MGDAASRCVKSFLCFSNGAKAYSIIAETGSAPTSSQEDGVEMEDCFETSKGESEVQYPALGVAVDEGNKGEEKTTL